MALLFSLSAECGPEEAASEFAAYFQGRRIASRFDGEHVCFGEIFQDGEAWWARVMPDGVSRSGVVSERDSQVMTDLAFQLYDALLYAPQFRYAIVGVEVDGFRYLRELVEEDETLDFEGLVLSDSVWRRLKSPNHFVPFHRSYRWIPFREMRKD